MNFTSLIPFASQLTPYIDYYYVQHYQKNDISLRYQCFPHLNHSLSLFRNAVFHFDEKGSHVRHDPSAPALQLLTVIRTAPLWVHHTGPLQKVGVVFKPLGMGAFSSVPLGELVPNFVEELDPFGGTLGKMCDELFSMADPELLTGCLDSYFLARLSPVPQHLLFSLYREVTDLGNRKPLHLIAEQHGISRRHMLRLFQQHMGCSPEACRQISRFRQTLQMATRPEEKQSLTQLAHATRHTDQSHWNKQCRKWTGYNPRKLLNVGTSLGQQDTFWQLDLVDGKG